MAIYLLNTSVIIDALNQKRGRETLIAATALIHKLVLMTDNRRDFPMPQLAMYSLP